MRSWGYAISLFTFLMSYRTIKGGSARQTSVDDRNEIIAGLIMMSEISYSRGLRLPIKRPLVRRLEGRILQTH